MRALFSPSVLCQRSLPSPCSTGALGDVVGEWQPDVHEEERQLPEDPGKTQRGRLLGAATLFFQSRCATRRRYHRRAPGTKIPRLLDCSGVETVSDLGVSGLAVPLLPRLDPVLCRRLDWLRATGSPGEFQPDKGPADVPYSSWAYYNTSAYLVL